MLVTIGTILRMTVHYRQFNVDLYNMIHYLVGSVDGNGIWTLDHTATWADKWFQAVKSSMCNTVNFVDVHVDEVNGIGFSDYAYPPNWTGTQAAQGLPTTVPYSIRKVRGSRLTRNGWLRLPGTNEATVNGNEVAPATRTALQNALTPLLVNELFIVRGEYEDNTVGLAGIIWAGNAPGYPLGKYQQIAAVDVRTIVGSQDSRRT